MSNQPKPVVLYLGAINDTEQPAAEAAGRAEAAAADRQVADVRWDAADQLEVDPLDRPVWNELFLNSPPGTAGMIDSATEARDPQIREFGSTWANTQPRVPEAR